jgi:hypothetical protein
LEEFAGEIGNEEFMRPEDGLLETALEDTVVESGEDLIFTV